MGDLNALQAEVASLRSDLEAAEAAQDALIEERRVKRESMTKAEFRAYNESTRVDQIEKAKAVADAQAALSAALNNARQEIYVGTISETNTAGGTS